jgi:uncharacterized protein (DUF1015 family)
MSEVRPFCALRYDPERVSLARVLAPPYDVVNAHERVDYWDRDSHNAIRLELTRDPRDEATTDYSDAARTLAAWRHEGVLRRDERPALYGLRQRFAAPDGSLQTRDGFFALLRLEEYQRRIVLPHERTLSAPKADRLRLLRATRANLSSVFMLYEDREGELAGLVATRIGEQAALRDDAGIEHTLVPIEDPGAIAVVQAFLAKRPLVIADGHHRYETALTYREERRGGSSRAGAAPDWVLAYFANAFAPGTLLLPIHRVVLGGGTPRTSGWWKGLRGWKERSVPLGALEQLPALLASHLEPLSREHAFAADDGSDVLRIFWRPASSAEPTVRVLHREVVEGIFGLDEVAVRDGAVAFPKSALDAARAVRRNRGAVALYLNPLAPEDVFRVTGAGERLPQKSTFFYPKLPTGLLFRTLEEEPG